MPNRCAETGPLHAPFIHWIHLLLIMTAALIGMIHKGFVKWREDFWQALIYSYIWKELVFKALAKAQSCTIHFLFWMGKIPNDTEAMNLQKPDVGPLCPMFSITREKLEVAYWECGHHDYFCAICELWIEEENCVNQNDCSPNAICSYNGFQRISDFNASVATYQGYCSCNPNFYGNGLTCFDKDDILAGWLSYDGFTFDYTAFVTKSILLAKKNTSLFYKCIKN